MFGLVKLLVLPLSVWFELRAARRRRRGAPTLLDEWPSVSIIVPAFNEATVIENCVRSIQLTRYDRYELILVADGSTDNTAGLMASLAATDLRITVLTQANAGKGAALNLGIRKATGDVLMFVDADGIFARGTVKRMLQGFADKRTGAVCGDDRPVNLNRVQTRMLAFISHVGTGMVRRALTMIGCLPIVSGNIGAFPRTILEEIGPFREDTVGEDLELTWRVHKAGYRVVFAPRALVYAESPSTLRALWRQRVRWARGLLQTMGVHRRMIGNLRHGRFGAYLLFNTITMVVLPVLQIILLLDLVLLGVVGRSPLGGDAWAVLGWLGLVVTLALTVFAVAMNRAWKDLRHVWALPLIPLYSVFTSLTMVAALVQEVRGKEAHWNKLTRTGVVSVTAPAPRTAVRV
ncbi:glycosyltransferase family 2 protein [Arthrobacter sp. RHLT1-20]